MAAVKVHEMPYSVRAEQPTTPSLTAYLLRLMAFKRSNLCLHAYRKLSIAQTLRFIEEIAEHIVAFRLHSDLLPDLRSSTAQRIVDLARKHRFLILDDRSFMGDGRSPAPATWTDLTTAHILMGAGVVPALRSAAHKTITSASVSTIIEQNTDYDDAELPDQLSLDTTDHDRGSPGSRTDGFSPASPTSHAPPRLSTSARTPSDRSLSVTQQPASGWEDLRKGSVVSISTTISSTTEYIVSPTTDHPPFTQRPHASASSQTLQSKKAKGRSDLNVAATTKGDDAHMSGTGEQDQVADVADDEEQERVCPPVPLSRGLLLHAHIDGSFTPGPISPAVTRSYARKCVEIAAAHRGYVIGLVVKTALPGAQEVAAEARQGLAPANDEGDGWRDYLLWADVSPDDEEADGSVVEGSRLAAERAIGLGSTGLGADVVCLGRGILDSRDRRAAVERVQKSAWAAYTSRVGLDAEEAL